MRLHVNSGISLACICVLLFALSPSCSAADLQLLAKGRRVHLVLRGHGQLCDGQVQEPSPNELKVKLLKTTAECGHKGEIVRISKEQTLEIVPQDRLTKRRIVAKLLLGMCGVAALAVVPLKSSDPEDWIILGNGVVPGFIFYAAWKAVPPRHEYLILMTCRDGLDCFSRSDR